MGAGQIGKVIRRHAIDRYLSIIVVTAKEDGNWNDLYILFFVTVKRRAVAVLHSNGPYTCEPFFHRHTV